MINGVYFDGSRLLRKSGTVWEGKSFVGDIFYFGHIDPLDDVKTEISLDSSDTDIRLRERFFKLTRKRRMGPDLKLPIGGGP